MKVTLIITDSKISDEDEDGVEIQLVMDPPMTDKVEPTRAAKMGMEISAMLDQAITGQGVLGHQSESIFRYAINRALMFLGHPQVGLGLTGWPAELRKLHYMAWKACEWARVVNRQAQANAADSQTVENTVEKPNIAHSIIP